MKTLLAVDGDGMLATAHFAVGHEWVSPSGEEVGGVDKFVQVLIRLISQWNVDAVCVGFDPVGKTTWRHGLYTDYKKTRPPKPTGLVHSKQIIAPILEALGATVFTHSDYEADDVVGSLVHATKDSEWRCVVVSKDKDLYGLLDYPHVVLQHPFAREPFTVAQLKEKWNITPAQLVDFLALVGDSVDNIPGVDGCGVVRAGALLQQYGSLSEILVAAQQGEIPKKLGESLRAQGARAVAFQPLLALKYDVPIPPPQACMIRDPDYPVLMELLEREGLHGLYAQARAERDAV